MSISVWVHPQFDPIAFSLGPLAVRWYGLMYLIAFVLVIVLGRIRLKAPQYAHLRMAPRDLDDLLLYGVLGVVLGGRLGHVLFYQPGYYLDHPAEILAIWQGGMAFHGGMLGVLLALLFFAWRRGLPFLAVGDFVAPLVPLGLAAGRLGNFINGELWGRAADPAVVPWAMVFPQAGDSLARHPSQLYQMALEGLTLFVALWWFSSRRRPLGAVSGFFLLGYGVMRFCTEFVIEPDRFLAPLPLGLSMGQWLSLPMMLAGVGLLVWSARKNDAGDGAKQAPQVRQPKKPQRK